MRLKSLYQHLVKNQKHKLHWWKTDYQSFVEDIRRIREALNSEDGVLGLTDPMAYQGTTFEGNESFKKFAQKLLYDKENGISSRGQSVLSGINFEKFIADQNFTYTLENLVKEPTYENYQRFREAWRDQEAGNNPVLINRTLAACTTKVSTTVDEGKFNQVYAWMVEEGLLPGYEGEQDWYHRNIHLMKHLHQEFADELTEDTIDPYWLSMFVWELYANLANPFTLKKQVIKYGAPGTGKTYNAKQNADLLFQIWKEEFDERGIFKYSDHVEIVQFHPSYSYEDFMEGMRPRFINGQSQLSLQNGIFKDFCMKAGKWEVDVANLELNKKWEDWTIGEAANYRNQLGGDHWQFIFQLPNKEKKLSKAVPPYFFVIDEVNRAELSRVFGELMYCLEYRGIDGAIKTQYEKLNTAETGMIKMEGGYRFFIPHNVYIIGTMNTIDRSVESFDFALRRRFRWDEMMPDIEALRYHLLGEYPGWVGLAYNLHSLNEKIKNEPLLGPDFQVGHAYLMNLRYSNDLTLSQVRQNLWEDSIKPLLQEYLRGTGQDVEQFEKAFGVV